VRRLWIAVLDCAGLARAGTAHEALAATPSIAPITGLQVQSGEGHEFDGLVLDNRVDDLLSHDEVGADDQSAMVSKLYLRFRRSKASLPPSMI
jgi:hypothetical protein